VSKILLLVILAVVILVIVFIVSFAVTSSENRLERRSTRVFEVVERGEQSLKQSLRVNRIDHQLQDEIPNPHTDYPFNNSGPTYANLDLAIEVNVEQDGLYRVTVIYSNPGNGLKSTYNTEVELSVGPQDVDVLIPASGARKDLGAWYSKLPLGSVEIITYKWTTEKELIGFELSQSEQSKEPAFWEVSRGEYQLD